MSNVKRKKSKNSNVQKNLEIVFLHGFHRVIIKSEENDRNIGVYYITSSGEFLKNTNDVIDWMDRQDSNIGLNRSNFNFISKKLTVNDDCEYFVYQSKLPGELLDYMLEKKKSIAPEITGVEDTSVVTNCNDEPLEKRIKIDEIIPKFIETPIINNKDEKTFSTNELEQISPLVSTELKKEIKISTGGIIESIPNHKEQEIIILSEEEQEIKTYEKNDLELMKTEYSVDMEISITEEQQATPLSIDDQEQQIPLSISDHEKEILPLITEPDQEIPTALNEPNPKETISLESCILKPLAKYEYPTIPMNQMFTFETGQPCHKERLMEYLHVESHEAMNEFRPNCSHLCGFDNNGIPRIAFECDVCLMLWHTDCIGYRWIGIETIKLIICDNCYLLQKTVNLLYPNLFCDIQMLYLQEAKPDIKQPDKNIQTKLEPIVKLCRMQVLMQNHSINLKKKKPKKKIINQNESNYNKGSKWKYFVQIPLNQENLIHDLKEDFICIKFGLDNIDRFSKIFSDPDCQMMLDDQLCEIIASRITVNKGEIIIPTKIRINKPCTAIFFTIDRNQDEIFAFTSRCEEFKTALITSYYSRHDKNTQQLDKTVKLIKDVSNRTIQLTPFVPVSSIGNRFKIISSNRLFLPRANAINCQSIVKTNAVQQFNSPFPNMVKIRQRKQDLGNQKCVIKMETYMKNRQFNLLNLPFSVLEQILSSPVLSTEDKLNCRLSNRILKCIVDGSQVWQKLVINPNFITGLENMWNFFRTKKVEKITFHIDFQESFGMEFLLSFISRLKIYPDYLSLSKFSIKFNGPIMMLAPTQLSVNDILLSCKSLKNLSITSEYPISLAIPKKKIASNSIVKLKLKNIKNIYYIIQSNEVLTPNLRKLYCGDWSFVSSIESMPLNQITHMALYFSQSISMSDMSGLCSLTNLEILSISRPIINEDLMNVLIYILKSKRLSKFSLKTLVPSKNSFDSCYKLSCCFPKTIPTIIWRLDFESSKITDEAFIKSLMTQIQEILTKNVRLLY